MTAPAAPSLAGGRPRRWLPAAVLTALLLALYGPALGRGFVSEDFLLLRVLAQHPPWRHPLAALTGPWLGIDVVRFYRPVSTALLALEAAAFGAHAVAFNVVHLLVHLANALLLYAFAARLRGLGRGPAFAAAVLFAVYPLHPNTVLFIASFATLFAATFLLAALVAYQRFRLDGGRVRLVVALALLALALGSYEAAVILPLLLMTYELLAAAGDGGRGGERLPRRLAATVPFFALVALYLAGRRAIFGVVLGGYAQTSQALLSMRPAALAGDLATSLVRLVVPVYDPPLGGAATALLFAALVLLPLAGLIASRRRLGLDALRLWLFGGAWTVVAIAPFAFRPAVPGNGRYWYLASMGVALAVATLAGWAREALAVAVGKRQGSPHWLPVALPAAVVATLALAWIVLLVGTVSAYRRAGATARAVQGELARVAAAVDPASSLFVTGVPPFLDNRAGVPVAQVLHYGLSDSIRPPFGTSSRPIYPLATRTAAELLPVAAGGGEARIFAWDAAGERLREVAPPSPPPAGVRELVPLPPADGALRMEVVPRAGERFRLVVAAEGNPAVAELPSEAISGGVLSAPLPREFVGSMDRLYGGEQFWWVEAHDAQGRLTAYSPRERLDLRTPD
jgi:hypothetical protein